MSKKKQVGEYLPAVDEARLFERVSEIIENRKSRAGAYANREVTLMYWEIARIDRRIWNVG